MAQAPPVQAPAFSITPSQALNTKAPTGAVDPVGNAPDLKRVFDEHIASGDPRQRRVAARAFEACVPVFMPGSGQAPSPEALVRALPPAYASEREAAYRSLFARCYRLVTEGQAALIQTLQTLERDSASQPPGQRAIEALLAGRLERIEPLVAEALSPADPAAVASLAGLATRLAASRPAEAQGSELQQRAQAVDAALPWVACDLGLDCSAQSLWALQLCATQGLCEGDVLARLAAGSVDPAAVQQQRRRLLGLIRSGRPLGTSDLLPP